MLTNEQCIEVAEKVWGWTYNQIGDNHCFGSEEDSWWGENIVQQKVNSWSGFGRTVEAMVEHLGYDVKHRLASIIDAWGYDYEGTKGLIEATHLAALEAINEQA